MTTYHRQCLLNNKNRWVTTWIPEEYAHIGKLLKIRDSSEDAWDEGWRVRSIGIRLPSVQVKDNSRDWLRQRKFSDI